VWVRLKGVWAVRTVSVGYARLGWVWLGEFRRSGLLSFCLWLFVMWAYVASCGCRAVGLGFSFRVVYGGVFRCRGSYGVLWW
jgi:hypothetical protein